MADRKTLLSMESSLRGQDMFIREGRDAFHVDLEVNGADYEIDLNRATAIIDTLGAWLSRTYGPAVKKNCDHPVVMCRKFNHAYCSSEQAYECPHGFVTEGE